MEIISFHELNARPPGTGRFDLTLHLVSEYEALVNLEMEAALLSAAVCTLPLSLRVGVPTASLALAMKLGLAHEISRYRLSDRR